MPIRIGFDAGDCTLAAPASPDNVAGLGLRVAVPMVQHDGARLGCAPCRRWYALDAGRWTARRLKGLRRRCRSLLRFSSCCLPRRWVQTVWTCYLTHATVIDSGRPRNGAPMLRICGKGAYLRALRVQAITRRQVRKAECAVIVRSRRCKAATGKRWPRRKKNPPAGCPAGGLAQEGILAGYSSGKRLDRRRMKVGMSRSESIWPPRPGRFSSGR